MQVWWLTFVISCSLVIRLTVSLPTTTAETDSSDSEVPREFPNFGQNYTFIDNSSIRENLAIHSDIDTEVDDLLSKDPPINEPEKEENVNPSEQEEDLGRKNAAEWIENGDDTEDSKFVTESVSKTTEKEEVETTTITEEKSTTEIDESTTDAKTPKKEFTTELSTEKDDEPYKDGVPIIDGSVAAILVGIFLLICVFGYTALILWRRSLELRYGSREMLVDKDDMYDPDDMKHFTI